MNRSIKRTIAVIGGAVSLMLTPAMLTNVWAHNYFVTTTITAPASVAPGTSLPVGFDVTTNDSGHDWQGWEVGKLFDVGLAHDVPMGCVNRNREEYVTQTDLTGVTLGSAYADGSGSGSVTETVPTTAHPFMAIAEQLNSAKICVESRELFGEHGDGLGVDTNGDGVADVAGVPVASGIHCGPAIDDGGPEVLPSSVCDSSMTPEPLVISDPMCMPACTKYNFTPRVFGEKVITIT